MLLLNHIKSFHSLLLILPALDFSCNMQISKWMTDKRYLELTSRDAATRLDLIAKVQGLKPAANYFVTLPQQLKGVNTYGSLLNCYCRVQSVEKAEAVIARDEGLRDQQEEPPLQYFAHSLPSNRGRK